MQSPAEPFFDWLTGRPSATRVAIAIDSDRLLTDAGLLGKERLTDKTGREWRLVVFRGDDIFFRKSFRQARNDKHLLLVLTRGPDSHKPIDITSVSDIIAANEGGPPFDGSVPAFFRELCPQINFPVAELRRFKEVLLGRLDAVLAAAKKIIERWGRPDDWGRAQVAALSLLVRHPNWSLDEIWPDELDPGAAIAHAMRLLLSVSAESPDLAIIRQMLPEAIRPQVKPGDIVLATSDHGFIELPPASAVVVAQNGTAELGDSVFYRYAKGTVPAGLGPTVNVEVGGERHILCVGRAWLKRQGIGQMARYSHGGVSLAELVVPAARLARVTEKVIGVELRDLPDSIAVDEDASVDLTFAVKNSGNVAAMFEISARDNLDRELLKESGQLAPAASRPLKLSILGTYRTRLDGAVDSKSTVSAVTVRLKYRDQSGRWRDALDGITNIPVKVRPKKTKLATDALSGFDEV